MSNCPAELIVIAAVFDWQKQCKIGRQTALNVSDATSPWLMGDNWRLNSSLPNQHSLWSHEQKFDVTIHTRKEFIEAQLNKHFYFIQIKQQKDDYLSAIVNNKPYELIITYSESQMQLDYQHQQFVLWTMPP